jgi:peptide/nickel transport system permease protein
VGVFVARRLAFSLLALIAALVLTFTLVHATPVDPARQYAGPRASEEKLAEVRAKLALDRSLAVQILIYGENFFTGDWGESLITKSPVIDDIGKTLPYTLELVVLSLILTLLIGLPLGVISANKKDRLPDHASRILAVGLISIPTFWLALGLQYLFSGGLGILPLSGSSSVQVTLTSPISHVTGFPLFDALVTGNFAAFGDHLRHLILPVVALAGMTLGAFQRITRSSMVEALSEDFIVAKRSYGLPDRLVLYRHGLKNCSGPIITTAGVFLAYMIFSTFIVESIFAWPGMGSYIVAGVGALDYPVIMAVTLVSVVAFLVLNTVADLVLAALDPRVRVQA